MRRFIQNSILAFTAWAALTLPAAAGEEHNPLDKLTAKTLCRAEQTVPPKKTTLMDLRVSKELVLKTAIGKNMLPPPDDLHTDRSYFDRLVDLVVPCSASAEPNELAARRAACLAGRDKYAVSESSRYASTDVRMIRQNLLRLFQSGVTGGTEDFVVVRNNRLDAPFIADDPSTGWVVYGPLRNRLHDDIMLLEYLYAPDYATPTSGKDNLVPSSEDPRKSPEFSKIPFEVFCRKRTVSAKDSVSGKVSKTVYAFDDSTLPGTLEILPAAKKKAPNAAILWDKAAKAGTELKWKNVKKETGGETVFAVDTYPHKPKKWADIAAKIPPAVGTESVASKDPVPAPKDISYSRTGAAQFIIAESPAEFIKSDRSGLSIGTSLGYDKEARRLQELGDAEIKVKGAIGARFIWRDQFNWKPYGKTGKLALETKDEWAVTPYLAIDLVPTSSVDCTEKKPCNPEEGADNPKKSISYGRTSAGIRLDRQFTPAATLLRESDIISPEALRIAGRAPPPWGYGAYLEYNTDNFNILSSRLTGVYVRPPASLFGWFGKSLRQSYPMDALWTGRQYGTVEFNDVDDAASGLYFKWDASIFLEHLDYARAPRDFTKAHAFQDGRVIWPAVDVTDGMSYGADASITLSRYNFLSLGEDDLTASLKVGLVSRRSFDLDNGNSADKATYTLTLNDPTGPKKRTWNLSYTNGEDPITRVQEETFSFNLTFAH